MSAFFFVPCHKLHVRLTQFLTSFVMLKAVNVDTFMFVFAGLYSPLALRIAALPFLPKSE